LISSSFFSSSSLASLFTKACISLAFSSFGTNSGTITLDAIYPHSLLNSSVLGVLLGTSILNTLALKQAIDATNWQ
jgi:hypothetical protein